MVKLYEIQDSLQNEKKCFKIDRNKDIRGIIMTLRHYEILRAVAQTGNFTLAAKQLYITQSAVSHAVREMEERTKTPLFERLSKGVRLTQAGEMLLGQVLPILASCENLEEQMEHLQRKARFPIVTSITIAIHWLPNILRQFQKKWPDIPVDVQVVTASQAWQILDQGKADVAFVEGPILTGEYESRVFDSYEMKVVCAPDYCQVNEMCLDEFCREKLLMREKGSAIRDRLDSMLYLKEKTIKPVWTSVNSYALIEAAKAGLGMTVLPDILLWEELKKGNLKEVTVEGLKLENEISYVIRGRMKKTEPFSDLIQLVENRKGKCESEKRENDENKAIV